MRGATIELPSWAVAEVISIHAPHARSDPHELPHERWQSISIHAPHARSDAVLELATIGKSRFQSTLLMRGAT